MNLSRRALIGITASVGAISAVAANGLFGGPGGRKLSAQEKSTCGLTIEAVEGPYWVSGMPELKDGNLNASGLPGPAIEVSGHVFDGAAGNTPLVNAEVEIWHADSIGAYHPNDNGPASNHKPADLALRGFVRTASDGSYRFTSTMPGEYTGRARHFHFKIRAAGKTELTTQLIVPVKPGDGLTFETDDIAEGLPNCQLLKIDETSTPARAQFDFRL